MDAPAGLPPCQQVDDGPNGHQANVPQPKADVASQVLPSWVTNIETYRQPSCQYNHQARGKAAKGTSPPRTGLLARVHQHCG